MLCEFIETSGFGLPGSGRCGRNPTQGGGTPTWSSCSPGKVCGGGESQKPDIHVCSKVKEEECARSLLCWSSAARSPRSRRLERSRTIRTTKKTRAGNR